MRIEHIAIWTVQLERLKDFYGRYFAASPGQKYVNAKKGFESYFLTFPGDGTRLELMWQPEVDETSRKGVSLPAGYAHLAISVGSLEAVEAITERIRHDGFAVVGEPRWTGDGYYESVVADPDGNLIEITI